MACKMEQAYPEPLSVSSLVPAVSATSTSASSESSPPIPFSAIRPFTMTISGILNQEELNLKEIFHQLPITETSFRAKDGKKVKIDVVAHSGAIIAAKCKIDGQACVRGIDKKTRPFNNCISLVMTVSGTDGKPEKNIEAKVFNNKFKTTGSRTLGHTLEAWSHMKKYLLQMTNVSPLPVAKLEIVEIQYEMIDISFDLGFKINRDNLKSAIDRVNGFHVIWEAGVHSNGVSVKFPLEPFDGSIDGSVRVPGGPLVAGPAITSAKQKRRIPPCISFIVFTTGKVIESGNNMAAMERAYDLFHATIRSIRDRVELRIKRR